MIAGAIMSEEPAVQTALTAFVLSQAAIAALLFGTVTLDRRHQRASFLARHPLLVRQRASVRSAARSMRRYNRGLAGLERAAARADTARRAA
jgi:hypothetical protein